MKLIYIIAPYTAETDAKQSSNIHDAKQLALYCWTKGYAVLCPHLNSSWMSGIVPEEQFYLGTLKMLSKCDVAIVVPNHQASQGSIAELAFAEQNSIPVIKLTKEKYRSILNDIKHHLENLK